MALGCGCLRAAAAARFAGLAAFSIFASIRILAASLEKPELTLRVDMARRQLQAVLEVFANGGNFALQLAPDGHVVARLGLDMVGAFELDDALEQLLGLGRTVVFGQVGVVEHRPREQHIAFRIAVGTKKLARRTQAIFRLDPGALLQDLLAAVHVDAGEIGIWFAATGCGRRGGVAQRVIVLSASVGV